MAHCHHLYRHVADYNTAKVMPYLASLSFARHARHFDAHARSCFTVDYTTSLEAAKYTITMI